MRLGNEAQGLLLAAIFVLVAIGLAGLAFWGIMTLNVIATLIGSVGEAAWFFAGKHIL